MTDLLILRHGPTVWNAEGRIQGHIDQPLSDAGRAVVRGWRLPDAAAGRVWYASPLARAWETAALLGLSPAPEPRLREMHWGEWEGMRLADLAAAGILTPTLESRGIDLRRPGPGGESPRDVQERLRPWLAVLAARGEPAGAVAHAGVIRALYALAVGWDMADKPPHKIRDACAHLFALADDGTPSLVQLNIPLEPAP
ncbi:putative phosphoglycerate mutase [Azospirillum fermentarium]|uniref:histidine phosphatase family protein n=1 Tax=Azospirillum fermentarium TaxID=1233114 RepID=UPI0022273B18|nr:histidine phosphatase family protein [Azospirillum fermentarium]MCW2244963.1 putative phosphoglycerate mutase [Azospirillum fermentarium]